VVAKRPSGQKERIRRFKTKGQAKNWIVRKSEAWLRKRGPVKSPKAHGRGAACYRPSGFV
jgi:hypothetical protein